MSKLSATKFIVYTILLSFSFTLCEAQDSQRPASSKPSNGLMAKPTGKKKATNAKGPVSVKNVKKKADDKDKKRKKDFVKYVKENQKRSIQIQTPEIQARMKQNLKDSNANYKAKKKRNVSRNRSAGRKYR